MDLGIKGRKAIVCASSKGLGRACARALAEAGCAVVLNGRDKEALERTASELRQATGVEIREIPGDLDDPATRAELIAACPDADILVNNNGGPPYKSFAEISREDVLKGVESNMLTPIALVQALAPGMAQRKFGRIINITSGSVRTPIAGLDVSSGARAGLTAFLASAARLFARDNVTINSIQPGSFETDRQKADIDPKPCAVVREDVGEASAGECTGQPLSRDRDTNLGRRRCSVAEGDMFRRVSASVRPPAVVLEPACAHAPCTGTGRSLGRP